MNKGIEKVKLVYDPRYTILGEWKNNRRNKKPITQSY